MLDYWQSSLLFFIPHIPKFVLIFSLFSVLLRLDPFLYIFQEYLTQLVSHHRIFFAFLRYILTVICIFEALQLMMLFILVPNAIICVLQKKSVAHFWAAKLATGLMFRLHQGTQLLFSSTQAPMDLAAFICVFIVELLGICGVFSTIAMRTVIPMPIYLLCPVMAVISFSMFQVILVPFTNFHEHSKRWIGRMRQKTAGCGARMQMKLIRQQIRSLRALTFSAGIADHRFFQLKTSTKSTFVENMMTFSISLLMSPLAEFKEGKGNANELSLHKIV